MKLMHKIMLAAALSIGCTQVVPSATAKPVDEQGKEIKTVRIPVFKQGAHKRQWTVVANDAQAGEAITYGTVKLRKDLARIRGLAVPRDRAITITVTGTSELGAPLQLNPQRIEEHDVKLLKRLVLNTHGYVLVKESTATAYTP